MGRLDREAGWVAGACGSAAADFFLDAFLSGTGQSGPAGQEATQTGVSECGLRPRATNLSILVAPGSSTRADTSCVCSPSISTQQTCWFRTYAGGRPNRPPIPSTTDVQDPELA